MHWHRTGQIHIHTSYYMRLLLLMVFRSFMWKLDIIKSFPSHMYTHFMRLFRFIESPFFICTIVWASICVFICFCGSCFSLEGHYWNILRIFDTRWFREWYQIHFLSHFFFISNQNREYKWKWMKDLKWKKIFIEFLFSIRLRPLCLFEMENLKNIWWDSPLNWRWPNLIKIFVSFN